MPRETFAAVPGNQVELSWSRDSGQIQIATVGHFTGPAFVPITPPPDPHQETLFAGIHVGMYADGGGWIEDAEGSEWIIFLDHDKRPYLMWREREPSGAVVTESVVDLRRDAPALRGWYVDLDRRILNKLIAALRRARDSAYGRDE